MILGAIASLIFGSVITLYIYLTTYDTKALILGLILTFLAVFGAYARYRFLFDTVWKLWKQWVNRT
ncbi:MAG: hypothetical protein P8X91_06590 [Candidatus Bathyarchaeota archaeon]